MAEVIAIVASLINISELGIKISQTLFHVGKTLIKAQEQINTLARELRNTSSAFEYLADVLESSNGLVKPEALRTTYSILGDCSSTYEEINYHITAVNGRSMQVRDRMTWVFRKERVKELQKRLESVKASLGLIVNILNLGIGIASLK